MGLPTAWYAVAAAITLINGFALSFIGWHERNRAVRWWAWAWYAWAGAVIPLALLGHSPHPLAAVLCGLFWVISTLCFLTGTYELTDRQIPRSWHIVAAGCVALAFALEIGPSGELGMIPLVLFQSIGLGATGVLLLRTARRHAGAWLAGLALIAFGLHLLDAPLAASNADLMIWGFVLAMALETLIALGMVVLHYEHARDQLLAAQRSLDEARRTEALGRIAGGVAHDFNNLLAVMQGHLDLVRLGTKRYTVEESLAAIERAVDQAKRLTTQLLAFGRRSVVRAQTVDVRDVVSETLDLLRKVIPQDIALELTATEGDYRTNMDRGLLEQIVLNLVTNGRDAIDGAGLIEVSLETSPVLPRSVLLRVRDDGQGMETTIVDQVFDPFFTTKATGTGLGLASVKGAVTQLGGSIEVHSTPGRGTTFEVTLPWSAPEDPHAPESGTIALRHLRVLLVEHNAHLRELTAAMLESAGVEVDPAATARTAMQRLTDRRYDIVLSDLHMPRLGGEDLVRRAIATQPDAVVVLTSGYPVGDGFDPDRVHFLPKPFHRELLLETLTRLTTRPATGTSSAGE